MCIRDRYHVDSNPKVLIQNGAAVMYLEFNTDESINWINKYKYGSITITSERRNLNGTFSYEGICLVGNKTNELIESMKN